MRLVFIRKRQATYQHRQVSYHREAAGKVRYALTLFIFNHLWYRTPKLAQAKLEVRAGTVAKEARGRKGDFSHAVNC